MVCVIKQTNIDSNIYRCIEKDKSYLILDSIDDDKIILETTVIDEQTLDEVEDSELFKRIMNSKSPHSYELQKK